MQFSILLNHRRARKYFFREQLQFDQYFQGKVSGIVYSFFNHQAQMMTWEVNENLLQ